MSKSNKTSVGSGESGVALVMALVVMVWLTIIIVSVGRDVTVDLAITRNTRVIASAFNRAEANLGMSEEIVATSVESKGEDTLSLSEAYYSYSSGDEYYTALLEVPAAGDALYTSGGEVTLDSMGETVAYSTVEYLGMEPAEGGSIIIAAGYEGVGKGAGGGGGVYMYFAIQSTGYSSIGTANRTVGEVYRYVLGGS